MPCFDFLNGADTAVMSTTVWSLLAMCVVAWVIHRAPVYIETLSRRRPRRECADVLSGPTPGHSRTTTRFSGTATTRNYSAQRDRGTAKAAGPRETGATGNSQRIATKRN